jgi:hypothetical protein
MFKWIEDMKNPKIAYPNPVPVKKEKSPVGTVLDYMLLAQLLPGSASEVAAFMLAPTAIQAVARLGAQKGYGESIN